MENKAAKKSLIEGLEKAGFKVPDIDLEHNYYSRAYGIPKE